MLALRDYVGTMLKSQLEYTQDFRQRWLTTEILRIIRGNGSQELFRTIERSVTDDYTFAIVPPSHKLIRALRLNPFVIVRTHVFLALLIAGADWVVLV